MAPQEPVPAGFVDGSLQLPPPPRASAGWDEEAAEAAKTGDVDGLKRLREAGWSPMRSKGDCGTALHWGAGAGQLAVVDYLVGELGVAVDQTNRSGRTALMWSARNAQAAACAHLRDRYAADILATTKDGINVFHWAVWSGDLDTCRWALAAGAESASENRWGCTAVHWASATGSVEMCEYLVSLGTLDFARPNNQGHNALHKAAWNGRGPLVEWLLALPDSESMFQLDRAGLSVADLARMNGHSELAAELAPQAGALATSSYVDEPSAAFTLCVRLQSVPIDAATLSAYPSKVLRLDDELADPLGFAALGFRTSFGGLVAMSDLACRRAPREFDEALGAAVGDGLAGIVDVSAELAVAALDVHSHHLCMCTGGPAGARYTDAVLARQHGDGDGATLLCYRDDSKYPWPAHRLRRGLKWSHPAVVCASYPGARAPLLFDDELLSFDRILVDPGDGATEDGRRPGNDRLRNWKLAPSVVARHHAAVKTLVRALVALSRGPRSRLVYTTSSLDPLLNEAVCLAALKQFKGDFVLVSDASAPSDAAQMHPGLTTWSVPDVSLLEGHSLFRWHAAWADVPHHQRATLRESLFHDTAPAEYQAQLSRCCRFVPPAGAGKDGDEGVADSTLLLPTCAFVAVFQRGRSPHESWETPAKPAKPTAAKPPSARAYGAVAQESADWASVVERFGAEGLVDERFECIVTEKACRAPPEAAAESLRLVSTGAARLVSAGAALHLLSAGRLLFERMSPGFLKRLDGCRWVPAQSAARSVAEASTRCAFVTDHSVLSALLEARQLSAAEIEGLDTALLGKLGSVSPGGVLLGAQGKAGRGQGLLQAHKPLWASCIWLGDGLLLSLGDAGARALLALLETVVLEPEPE